jgi:SAM-dependent methyltransferase
MRLHTGIPRQGPGSDQTTLHALSQLPPLSNVPNVYDVGCGTGSSALFLAKQFGTKVIAVDLNQAFLDELQRRANEIGLSRLIETRCLDMKDLSAPPESIDLIWSEGAIYTIGFDNGLRAWRPHLKPQGLLVCTEISWLADPPPEEALAFWQKEYPGMRSRTQNVEAAKALGYRCLNSFVLPPNCWWDEYYTPLCARIEKLAPEADNDPALADVLQEVADEIRTYEKYEDAYGYVFYTLQKQ